MLTSIHKIVVALAIVVLSLGIMFVWRIVVLKTQLSRYERQSAANTKAVQQALANAEAAEARAREKEAQAEMWRQQIDARSAQAHKTAQELLLKQKQEDAALRAAQNQDLQNIARPATECVRARDTCERFKRLAQLDASWQQYVCQSDPCSNP